MTRARKMFWVFLIQPSGIKEAEQVIEMLITHPSTAKFISTKLARRFIADEPSQALIEKAAQTFINTKGDIKSVLRVILLEGLPLAQPKYKRPANFVCLRCVCSMLKPMPLRFRIICFAWVNFISTGPRPMVTPTPAKPGRAASCRAGNLLSL